MKTIWKDIDGAPGYQVSSDGMVKSVERVIKRGTNFLPIRERILKAWKRNKDYLSVGFRVGGKRKVVTVHRLIASAFIPNPENKPEINHIDGDKTNNSVENLEWATASENVLHAYATGLKRASRSKAVRVEMPDGTILRFDSMKDCGEHFELGKEWVRSKVRRVGNTFTYKGHKFTVMNNGEKP